jgi:hypothetical protein
LLRRWVGEASAQLGNRNILDPLVYPPEVALWIAYPCHTLPEGELGRMRDWPSAGCHTWASKAVSRNAISASVSELITHGSTRA